jgi:fumarylacetoacetase
LLELLSEGSSCAAPSKPRAQNCCPGGRLPDAPAGKISDYTDFYVGIEHAQNVGKLFRPDNPLLPNYKYVPIGYHGRASTIRPPAPTCAARKARPCRPGQRADLRPCARLDYELELGIWIGQGNDMGEPIADWRRRRAHRRFLPAQRLVGARYPGLGIPAAGAVPVQELHHQHLALGGDRRSAGAVPHAQPARPEGDPQPLPYLLDKRSGGRCLRHRTGSAAADRAHARAEPARPSPDPEQHAHMYWTVAQMVAHHSVNGCQLQAGDLFGSGTLSGPAGQFGSLLEITEGGKKPIELASGEVRKFLEDGDEIILRCAGLHRLRRMPRHQSSRPTEGAGMELYTYYRSTSSYRVRIALALKGLDYQACRSTCSGRAARRAIWRSTRRARAGLAHRRR